MHHDAESIREAPRKSRFSLFGKVLILLGVITALSFFVMIASIAGLVGRLIESGEASGPEARKAPHLVQLNVEGPIYDATPVLEILRRLEDDGQCKGVLLRVESPGGAVGASQEILAGLQALRARGVPLAVSFGNVAASGGYYIALAGERIFANPGSLTGSIGVIFQFPELEKLMEKAGVSLQTVKSGALKDVGNPARKATPEELAYLQNVIDDTYAQFLGDVAEARGLHPDSLRPFADGRVFTGRQALAAGLVDTLGGVDAARGWLVARTGADPGIEWSLEPRPRSRLEQFLAPEGAAGIGEWLAGVRQRLNPGAFFLWP